MSEPWVRFFLGQAAAAYEQEAKESQKKTSYKEIEDKSRAKASTENCYSL